MKTISYNNFSDEAFDLFLREVAERPDKLKAIHASIREWVDEFPIEFRRERRKEYLLEAIRMTKEAFFKACRTIVSEQRKYDEFEAFTKDKPYNAKEDILAQVELYRQTKLAEHYDKKLKRFNWEAEVLTGKTDGLSPEKIARARAFPIEELLATQHGRAICPFHDDHHPSMDVRKNFYYCYTCGANGDVVDLAMHIYHIPFREAVDKLSKFYW